MFQVFLVHQGIFHEIDPIQADKNRHIFVEHGNFARDYLKQMMSIESAEFDTCRLFTSLTIANLVMNESVNENSNEGENDLVVGASSVIKPDLTVKEKLMVDFGLYFFFPHESTEDVVELRTSVLCLSELFESEKNRNGK